MRIVGYEFTHNPDLPPLEDMRVVGEKVVWDRPPNVPETEVDFDQLARLGYCVPIYETDCL